jgi:hypothetical protein
MWMPLALAASLAIGYFVPHPAAAPLSGGLIATVAVPAGTRSAQGQGQEIVVDKQAAYFLVRLDVADDVTAPRLSWRVRTAGGQELHFQTVRENQAVLPLRAADFPAGKYELILSPDTPDPEDDRSVPLRDQVPLASIPIPDRGSVPMFNQGDSAFAPSQYLFQANAAAIGVRFRRPNDFSHTRDRPVSWRAEAGLAPSARRG